jgi:hypothetical protein
LSWWKKQELSLELEIISDAGAARQQLRPIRRVVFLGDNHSYFEVIKLE